MSRPTAISPEEQEQIARQIGVLLLRSATEDWQQITVEYRSTGGYHDLLGEVTTQNGVGDAWDPPEELVGVFEHLREGMYRPDVGTWLSALYVVDRPSSYRIDINFDTEPQWNRPLPRAAYVDEFRRYPRADENIPDWVQSKLDSSAAPATEHVEAAVPSAPPEPEPAATAPAPTLSPSVERADHDGPDGALRRVPVFDGQDDQGHPVVTARKPVAPEEMAILRQYLENAPVVVPSQDTDTDRLDPNSTVAIATNWHTDGTWLWQDAVAFYLARYGVPPQNEFVDDIRRRQFTLPEIDDHTREAARREVLANTAEVPAVPPSVPVITPPPADDTAHPLEQAVAESVPAEASPPVIATDTADPESPAVVATVEPQADDTAGADAGLSHEPAGIEESASVHEDAVEEDAVDEDAETVLSILRKKLTAYEVGEDSVGIAERIPRVRCLVRDGSQWLVTAGEDQLPSGEARFARIDQAAAYLLGSVLLYRAAPERPTSERPSASPAVEAPVAPPPVSEPPTPEPPVDTTSRKQPPERESGPGGHFLFTDNQGQASADSSVPPPRQNILDRTGRREGGSERQPPAAPEPTPFQPVSRPDRPAPSSPPTGQPAVPPAAQGPAPGQSPVPLPKRTPRMDQNGTGRPPERPGAADRLAGPPQPGAGGLGPAGGAERRPGPGGPSPAGPPRQGPMPGAVPRPPQGPAPVPGAGREQQIQPLQGEPPLTLYRDRRPALLQPGTEVDRFGDPTGNVAYVARTPYSKRSLPPQWSGRPYVAYRVQRPLQALQGTAVPWFEQPGGGTAYVLPVAIADLLADGTLIELSGNEAPLPPMD